VLFLPIDSVSAPSIYSIQTGAFSNKEFALKEFDSLVKRLDEKDLDHLRVEKIKKIYSVRIGKFKDRATAKKFLQRVKPLISSGFIKETDYVDERIIRLYKSKLSTGKEKIREKPPLTRKVKPKTAKEAVQKKKAMPPEEQIRIVSELVNKKDYQKALEAIKAGISSQPDSPELNGWYGTVLLKMDDPSKAIKYFRRAAELSPDRSDYHNGTGYCLLFLRKFNDAIIEFNKAVDLEPDHIDALTGLGTAYAKAGVKDKATDIYNTLKGIDRGTADKLLEIIEGKR
jgi:tetratricopeptide (TPR) repeat protein